MRINGITSVMKPIRNTVAAMAIAVTPIAAKADMQPLSASTQKIYMTNAGEMKPVIKDMFVATQSTTNTPKARLMSMVPLAETGDLFETEAERAETYLRGIGIYGAEKIEDFGNGKAKLLKWTRDGFYLPKELGKNGWNSPRFQTTVDDVGNCVFFRSALCNEGTPWGQGTSSTNSFERFRATFDFFNDHRRYNIWSKWYELAQDTTNLVTNISKQDGKAATFDVEIKTIPYDMEFFE